MRGPDGRDERDEVVGQAVAGLPVPAHGSRFWDVLDARLEAEAGGHPAAEAGVDTAGGDRDRALGRAVGALAVPDHGAGFWTALDDRLAREDRAGTSLWLAPEPRPAAPVAPVATAGAPGVTALAVRRGRRRPNRFGAAVTALSVAAAVALVAFAIVGRVGGPEPAPLASAPASGPEPRVAAAVPAQPQTVTGSVVERIGGEVRRWEVTLAADGSRREVSEDPEPIVRTYDATTTSGAFVNGDPATTDDVGRNLGYAPVGGPDPAIATFLPLDLAAHVTGQARAGSDDVEEVTYLGRPAWRQSVEHLALAGTDIVWRAEVVVDQETALPLSVVEDRDGTVVEVTFTRFEVATQPAERDRFGLTLPVARPDLDHDAGYDHVDASGPGLVRPDPDALPEGFVLDRATRSADGATTTVVYRRGFEQVLVRVGPDLDGTDPFTGVGAIGPGRPVELAGGDFAGPAELVLDPPTAPHVWASDGERVASVSGPLSGEQLVAVAATLGHG